LILRYIHKVWTAFWRFIFSVAGILAVTAILVIGLLQLPMSKSFLRYKAISSFNTQYEGTLVIEDLGGFLPFTLSLENGRIYEPGDTTKPVLSFEQASVQVNWWQILQRNLAVSSMSIDKPTLYLDRYDGQLTISRAFARKDIAETEPSPQTGAIFPLEAEIYAPGVSVAGGNLQFGPNFELPPSLPLSTPATFEDINFEIFLEITDSQVFFDLNNFFASLPDTPFEFLQLNGQFYNDDQFFELNRFRFSTALSEADFSFEATPVSLFRDSLESQFQEAQYRLQISESNISSDFVREFFPNYPNFEDELQLVMESEGDLNQYFVDRFQANIGESYVLLTGDVNNLLSDNYSYRAQLDNVVLQPDMLEWFSDTYFEGRYELTRYQISTVRGELNGSYEEILADFNATTRAGAFTLDGGLQLGEPLSYTLDFQVDTLDISPFLADTSVSSVIQGRVALNGEGVGKSADIDGNIDLSQSVVYGVDFREFNADFNYLHPSLGFSLQASDGNFRVDGEGQYEQRNGSYRLAADANLQNFNLKTFYNDFYADNSSLNSSFSVDLEGSGLSDMTGRFSVEVNESSIDGNTLPPHQIYADVIQNQDDTRSLRMTSSFFDGQIRGNLKPKRLRYYTLYWGDYFRSRIGEEFLFSSDFYTSAADSVSRKTPPPQTRLEMDLSIKDLSLLQRYLPNLPEIESNAELQASADASADRLILNGNLSDPSFRLDSLYANNFDATVTASFLHQFDLKQSSTLDIDLMSGEAGIGDYQLRRSSLNVTMRNDSIRIDQNLERLEDDLVLQSSIAANLKPDRLTVDVEDFSMGPSEYQWTTRGIPAISYTENHKVIVDSLIVTSGSDYIEVDGIFSNDFNDSVNYSIQNLDLNRISSLIGGRVTFSGLMNGSFETRTLGQIPSIQGNLQVERGRVMDRLVGDLTLESTFNSDLNRFDTQVRIFTDPDKYQNYLARNDGIGQDLLFDGYFKLPGDEVAADEELFNFEANLEEIDMWIVPVIIPNIIVEMEGEASGTGRIYGTQDDFEFESRFTAEDVRGVPVFTNVEYLLNGDLQFSKSEGLRLDSLRLQDNDGGTGIVTGTVDMNDFQPTKFIDLTMDLDGVQFMNNPYDPDIPFYGSISGTGQATLTGTNFQPVLRTTRPLQISSSSRINIPLEPQTEVEEARRFIEFVDSFDPENWWRSFGTLGANGNGEDEFAEELTFAERFTMDLQFQAPNPISVDLIFDRVTNDRISANGTGQIRMLLEDQDVSMFGTFNITDGNYRFVSGDIFSRTFNLAPGGSISWSGDLTDASLDVTAIYRARPDIRTLLATSGGTDTQQSSQRIPVELVLEIGGTMTEVENDFFFRVPTDIQGTVDPTLSTQISNLNQNEDEKLVQATSILITGNFIPPAQAQGLGLTESLTGSSVVNPLITSQLINPLLSNQINSLLRSDITFDIDVNLNTFNEVDLGVALRLFDDRIVLRREGQITGEQSDIGDIGATYRINDTFSVTAFHRQDPTLSYTSGVETQQAQEMNGVGLEAQVQFNTWQKLKARITGAFRSLFGIKEKETNEEEPIAQKNE
jgi:hypothetical protein